MQDWLKNTNKDVQIHMIAINVTDILSTTIIQTIIRFSNVNMVYNASIQTVTSTILRMICAKITASFSYIYLGIEEAALEEQILINLYIKMLLSRINNNFNLNKASLTCKISLRCSLSRHNSFQ